MTFDVQFPALGLEFTVNRVAFSIGGFNIYWYGVLIAAGMVLAMLFAFSRADDFGINSDRLIDVVLVGAVMAIVCARIYYVAFAPFSYESIWEILDIRQGGIAIYGAVIGAFVFGGLMARLRHVPILPLFDLVGICFLIGQSIGRWGNFVNQEAFGCNTDLPWGMYSDGTRDYLTRMAAQLAQAGVAVDPSRPVHPTFLYESLWCLIGFLLLSAQIKKRRFHGELFLLYLIWYGAGRFWIEGLRTDALMATATLRTSQLVALTSVAVSVVLLVLGLRRARGTTLMVPLQVADYRKAQAAGTGFERDELPASASHRDFVAATAEMNRRLAELDLDETSEVVDNRDTGAGKREWEEGNVDEAPDPDAGQADEPEA